MILHKDSHTDYGLTKDQVDFIVSLFSERREFFIASLELPAELGTVPCGLFGPDMGDAPVSDEEVTNENRGERAWTSRLVSREPRPTRTVTVIAGPHDGHECVLFTAFGGPHAPREPGDPSIKDDAELRRSKQWWSEHALAKAT